MFLHAFSGCNKTSSFFGNGKVKLWKELKMKTTLPKAAELLLMRLMKLDRVLAGKNILLNPLEWG